MKDIKIEKLSPVADLSDLPSVTGELGWPWDAQSPLDSTSKDDSIQWPRITVVTPSYNQGRFLEATIRSVLLQAYPNLEYIILDAGSKDESVEIIKKYEHWLSYWVSEKDEGQTDAINRAWLSGSGTILAWLNSDDYYQPGALFSVAEAFMRSDSTVAAIGGCGEIRITEDGRKAGSGKHGLDLDPARIMKGGNTPAQPAIFVSQKAFRELGLLDKELYYAMDWDYWLRLACRFSQEDIYLLAKELAVFTVHKDAKVPLAQDKAIQERRKILDRLFKGSIPPELLALKKTGDANTYWREGIVLFRKGHIRDGVRCWIEATKCDRVAYPLTRILSKALKESLLKVKGH